MNIESQLKKMTLRQKIGQMFLHSFVGYKDLPENLKDLNRKGELGGFLYFSGSNCDNLEQTKKLSENIQKNRKESPLDLPYLICLDQEGGQLTALHRGASIFPGNMALGFANNKQKTQEVASTMAKELNYAGININFGPVVDVSYDSVNGEPIVDNRMFSSDPKVVSEMGTAYLRGMHEEGLLSCAKHFPGQRLTQKDTHHALDRIDYSLDRLKEVELAPFQAMIDEGVDSIMTHHGIYNALDPENPGTMSTKVMSYLRDNMGFQGVIVSDDIIMKAIIDNYGEKEALLKVLQAGVDLIIFSGAGSWFIDFVEQSIQEGKLSESSIDDSVKRILRLKQKIEDRTKISDLEKNHFLQAEELSKEVSQAGILCTKGEDFLPLNIHLLDKKRVQVILANPARLVMSCTVNFFDISFKHFLESNDYFPYVKEAIMPWAPTEEEALSLWDIGFTSDILIFTTVNGYNFSKQIDLLKRIHGIKKNRDCKTPFIISIATRSPQDIALLEAYSDCVLCSAGLTPYQIEGVCKKIFTKN